MQLHKVAAVIRPRNQWEAIDLGFLMARRWWRPLLLSWLTTALPIMLLLTVLFYWSPWIGLAVFWWLKPLYEQAPLVLLSRALFDDMPATKTMLRDTPRIALKQALLNLTWRRFSFMRSFTAPVAQLEGLSGKPRQNRLDILLYGQGASSWLTVIGYHFEAVIYFSLYALIVLMLPTELQTNTFGLIDPTSLTGLIFQSGFYLLAAASIAPFYIAGGFALYLNRRVSLEGWDIELAFKKLQQRTQPRPAIGQLALALLCGCLLLGQPLAPCQAEEAQITPEQAKQEIETILAGEAFGEKRTEHRWFYIGENEESETATDNDWDLEWLIDLARFISRFAEILLWAAVGLLIMFVVLRFSSWKRWFKIRAPSRTQKSQTAAPTVLFGLEVTEESLPDDLIESVTEAYRQGNYREALSLLYRGSLARLMLRDNIHFSASFTEGECISLVERQHPNKALIAFFEKLTRHWICMAYAHQPPDPDAMQLLCSDWPKHFDRTSSDQAEHAA